MIVSECLLAKLYLCSHWISVSKSYIFYLSPWLYNVTISNITIINVGKDSKDIIRTDFHNILALRLWFENNQCLFLNDVVIAKNDFEGLVFILAENRACGIYYATLAKNNSALYLVLAEIYCFLIHLRFDECFINWI